MNEIIKPAGILLVITMVAAMLLGMVSEVTKEPIRIQNEKTQNEAMKAVLPNAESFEKVSDAVEGTTISLINKGIAGGEECGYVINVAPSGFSGAVGTMVGINLDGTISGVRVLSHAETPGLGAKSTEPAFYEQYNGKQAPITVIKAGTPDNGQIQAITSATITSNAVTDGVNEAYAWFEENGGAN